MTEGRVPHKERVARKVDRPKSVSKGMVNAYIDGHLNSSEELGQEIQEQIRHDEELKEYWKNKIEQQELIKQLIPEYTLKQDERDWLVAETRQGHAELTSRDKKGLWEKLANFLRH